MTIWGFGLSVGVASDENVHGTGRIDAPKRKLLLAAGADLVVPDYRDAAALIEDNVLIDRK